MIKTLTRIEVQIDLNPELAIKLNSHLKSTLGPESDNELLAFSNELDNAVTPKQREPRKGGKPGPKPKNQAPTEGGTPEVKPEAKPESKPESKPAEVKANGNGSGKTKVTI